MFARHAKPYEMGFVFPGRQVAKLLQRGLCLAAGPLDTQHCDGPAPGHISDPVALQSGGPHWQPQVVTALASWCGVALADKGEQGRVLFPLTALCKKETSGPGGCATVTWLLQTLAHWLPPYFQGGPGLGKGILAFSDCTYYLMCPSARIICIRSRFHKPFFL